MAYITGTVNTLHGALEVIRDFLKNNSTLAGLSPAQTWEELRYIEDNIVSVDTNATASGLDTGYLSQLFRPSPRWKVTDNSTNDLSTSITGISLGNSFIRWQMRTAKAIDKIEIRGLLSGSNIDLYNFNSFRLQYSDDNLAWSTAATITGQTNWGPNEVRTFSGWSATGDHIYWRILIDAAGNAGNSTQIRPQQILCYSADELVSSTSAETYLKGPGLAEDDEIFIGFRTIRNPGRGRNCLQVLGFTGFNPNTMDIYEQPGAPIIGAGPPVLPLWDQPMTYWISGNGRRVVFCFKVTTVYSHGYAGFILPYASPAQYPYPLAVSGSISMDNSYTTLNSFIHTSVNQSHAGFSGPGSQQSASQTSIGTEGSLLLMQPTGLWEPYRNQATSASDQYEAAHAIMPHSRMGATQNYRMPNANEGGGYLLFPIQFLNRIPAPQRYIGELDGVYLISGHDNSAENTGTVGDKDYIVFQNAFRTGKSDYWAMEIDDGV